MKKVNCLVVSVFLLLTAFVLLHSTCFADNAESSKQLTVEQKLEDFNYTYNIIKDNFPYLEVGKRMTGFDWLAHRSDFERKVRESKDDAEFRRVIGEMLGMLNDGHTGPTDYNFGDCLEMNRFVPLYFVYVEGKYVLIDSLKHPLKHYGVPMGSVLQSINNVRVDEYVKANLNKTLIVKTGYDYKRKKVMASGLIVSTNTIQDVVLKFETPEKKQIKKVFKTEKITIDDFVELSAGSKPQNMATKILLDKKIAYVKVNLMNDASLEEDGEKIYSFLSTVKDYPYLIIDIRGNPGGNAQYWEKNIVEPLLHKTLSYEAYMLFKNGEQVQQLLKEWFDEDSIRPISELPDINKCKQKIGANFKNFVKSNLELYPCSDQIDFRGKIYLVIDSDVYSAADMFAAFAKNTGWATLVGTNTGGDGMGHGFAFATLPNSQYEFHFATSLGMNLDGTINAENPVQADIYIEPTINDRIKGRVWRKQHKDELINPYDTVLNKLLDMLK